MANLITMLETPGLVNTLVASVETCSLKTWFAIPKSAHRFSPMAARVTYYAIVRVSRKWYPEGYHNPQKV